MSGSISSLPSSMTNLYFSNNLIDDVSMTSYMPLLADCDGLNNPLECPMTSQVASQCDTSCTVRDETSASFRVRVAGDMSNYDKIIFSQQLAQTMNITSDRINVNIFIFFCIFIPFFAPKQHFVIFRWLKIFLNRCRYWRQWPVASSLTSTSHLPLPSTTHKARHNVSSSFSCTTLYKTDWLDRYKYLTSLFLYPPTQLTDYNPALSSP